MIQTCAHCTPLEVDTTSLWCMEERHLVVWAYVEHQDHCPDWSQGWFVSHVVK